MSSQARVISRFSGVGVIAWIVFGLIGLGVSAAQEEGNRVIPLPPPDYRGEPVEVALLQRRSVREFSAASISLESLSQLLWAAQGVTSEKGFRTAPSAGALYPLEVDVVAGAIDGVQAGLYRYRPREHQLLLQKQGAFRRDVADAALHQQWLSQAAGIIIIRGVERRTTNKYGNRAKLYVPMEAGAAMQNILLQAVSLKLGAAPVGAFREGKLIELLGGAKGGKPLLIIPVGHPRSSWIENENTKR